MTQLNPFEAPAAATHVVRPSILVPTAVTALVAVVLFAVPSIARGIDPTVSCCWNCTAGIFIWFLGALPAWMLWRQGPYSTGGHAFAAAFIGVGCGSGLGVVLQMIAPGMEPARLHELTESLTKKIVEESERQGQQMPVPQDELRDALEGMCLAAPIPVALIGTVVAGFVGMLALSLLMRRPPPPTPPSPPTQAPLNPYSDPQA